MSVIKELIEALESDKYEQVQDAYLNGYSADGLPMCCALGTLVLNRGGVAIVDPSGSSHENKDILKAIETELESIDEELVSTIIAANDDECQSFDEIADYLRDTYPQYLT